MSKSKIADINRLDFEPPLAIEEWGWSYHHIGIPANNQKQGEVFLPDLKMYVSGFDTSPFGIEWMRFEKGSTIDELIRRVPHIAFEVNDLDNELKMRKLRIITKPNSRGDGIRVAMIEHNGAPVELIEFRNKKR
jgi:hypothetical protein